MNSLAYSRKTVINVIPILGLAFALAGRAQSVPDGPEAALFQRTCSTCHALTVVTAKRLSAAGWQSVVDDMVSRGAQASPDEFHEIVQFLAANFGAAAPAAGTPGRARASAPPPAQPAPVLDPSQIARAKEIVQTNGCLSCHRIGDNGSYAGPYLGDVGATHSAAQIRAALVSPNKDVASQNRSVRLVTHDGNTLTGRLLNQDGFSVQIIDASGHLLSFDKASLRDFTILTANNMPAYTDKLAPEDLSLLVQYLQTLTDKTQQ